MRLCAGCHHPKQPFRRVAGKLIRFAPGFAFKASTNASLRAYIDETLSGEEDPEDEPEIKDIHVRASGNYIITITPLDAAQKASIEKGKLEIDANTRALVNIRYFDGFGRPLEQVQAGVTPEHNDLVSLQEYDSFGRRGNTWLPSMVSGNAGAFVPVDVYKSTNAGRDEPYAYPVYEDSPLGRVREQYGPGKSWHQNGKPVKTTEIEHNSSFTVPLFTVTSDRIVYCRNHR